MIDSEGVAFQPRVLCYLPGPQVGCFRVNAPDTEKIPVEHDCQGEVTGGHPSHLKKVFENSMYEKKKHHQLLQADVTWVGPYGLLHPYCHYYHR